MTALCSWVQGIESAYHASQAEPGLRGYTCRADRVPTSSICFGTDKTQVGHPYETLRSDTNLCVALPVLKQTAGRFLSSFLPRPLAGLHYGYRAIRQK